MIYRLARRKFSRISPQGRTNKEIARALNIAEATVKIHVQHILHKLKLSSRVQAAAYAVAHAA